MGTIPLSSSRGYVSAPEDDRIPLETVLHRLAALTDGPARRAVVVSALRDLAADTLLPALKDESERYLTIDPYISLWFGEMLVFAGEAAGRATYRALGLMALGDAYKELGRYQESVAAMDAAGDAFLACGEPVGWARTRIGWVQAFHRLGHGAEALVAVERAREILVAHASWFRAATLDLNAGIVCYELGRYEEAIARYDRALTIYESLGEAGERRAAWARMNKAIVLRHLGDFAAALRLYGAARAVHVRYGDAVTARRLEHNVAGLYAAQGKYGQALYHFGAVYAAHEQAGLETGMGQAALDMAECHLHLNRHAEALALAEETVARFERCGTPTEAAKARFLCALALTGMGDITRALDLLNEAAAAFAAAGLTAHLALAALQRATLLLADGNWPVAWAEAGRARERFAERGMVVRRAQADLIAARAAIGLCDHETAAALAHAALAVGRERDVPWLAHECHHILGDVAAARGDQPGALAAYGAAVVSVERLQSSLAVEMRTHFLADKVQAYEKSIAASLRLARPAEAFAYLERMKSRALVDYLAGNLEVRPRVDEGTSGELLGTLTRLREEHHGLYRRLYGYGLAGAEGTHARDEKTLRAAVREREREIGRVVDRLALARTEGLTTPAREAGETFAVPTVADGTVVLEYFFREDGGMAFVVSADGLVVVPLAVRSREIVRLLAQWQLNLGATAQMVAEGRAVDALGRNARGILAALYRALVAPVAAHLAGCARLIVVPYGPTHAVPFHALYDGERHLLERVEVACVPSSAVLRLCVERPRTAGSGTLVLAHTDGGRLPGVLDEARAVAALMPGVCHTEAAATRVALMEAAPRYRVLHLAAHGEARPDNPAFAHLALADGHLTTTDVFNLRLHGALVTLSACETGRSVMAGGDELMGLSRGFLYAGAATLVQSLWRVEDSTTAALMTALYRALWAGQSKGAALRNAQRALLATHGVHPYYWAPFQLIGDAGPL